MDRIVVTCPRCKWQFHAPGDAIKISCINPECGEEIRLAKKDTPLDAARPERPMSPAKEGHNG
jgi:hypothetical protein